jgi:hypothetical protein
MVYISIGCACNVKYQIDKHKHKLETLFFDWLMTSMKSVIEILGCDDINNILYFDNIIRDQDNPFWDGHSRIIIRSLDYCVSIHDILCDFTDKDILDFIEKYKRRFNRIIEYIKSDEKIYFVRFGSIDNYSQQKFVETILKINPDCNFAIVVIDNNKENNVCILKDDHCLYMKLNIDEPTPQDWTTEYLNWDLLFLEIENNI